MKNELEKVRDWTAARLRAGSVPDWSWEHHAALIEALDAVLHDLSLAGGAPDAIRRHHRNLRLVEGERHRASNVRVTPQSVTKRKAGLLQ